MAMFNGGWRLIYGVAEDRKAKTLSPMPLSLVGFKERISQILETRVRRAHPARRLCMPGLTDRPTLTRALPCRVPASLRAPHQVTSQQANITDVSPAGPWSWVRPRSPASDERRQRAEDAALKSLDEAISLAPRSAISGRGDLYLVGYR